MEFKYFNLDKIINDSTKEKLGHRLGTHLLNMINKIPDDMVDSSFNIFDSFTASSNTYTADLSRYDSNKVYRFEYKLTGSSSTKYMRFNKPVYILNTQFTGSNVISNIAIYNRIPGDSENSYISYKESDNSSYSISGYFIKLKE